MNRNKSEKYRNLKIEISAPIKKGAHVDGQREQKPQAQLAERQLRVRKEHQIDCMQSEVKKITAKIDSEKKLLRNRVIAQELQQQLRKNQIAAQMSKREIILQKLNLLKNQKELSNRTEEMNKKGEPTKNDINNDIWKTEKKTIEQKKRKKKRIQNGYMSINNSARIREDSEQKKKRLKQIIEKQKQYGKMAYQQFRNNRVKSALSFLELKRSHEALQLKKTEQRQKILQDLKKPRIQYTLDRYKQTKKYINSIQKSQKSVVQKIEQLNYLSELLSHQMNQNKEGDQSILLLTHLNKVRTKLLLIK